MDAMKGSMLAASVAAMLATMACSSSGGDTGQAVQKADALVKCEGINECKGTSECKSSDGKSACQGLNGCKGQGWISVPAEECSKKGGKVLAGSPMADAPAPPPAASDGGAVAAKSFKCQGINECKGTSACKSADNACKGQNECKGHGWVEVPTESDCSSKGGKVIS